MGGIEHLVLNPTAALTPAMGGGEAAAWEAFYAWLAEQDFSEMPVWAVRYAIDRKRRELGLEI